MRLLQKAELPREMCYSCEKNVAGEGGGGGRVRLSTPINSIKLLMIKQIENVRKELSTSLMNGTAHRIFMTYESTRLLPLFHSKLISTTGARPTSLRAGSLCSDTSGEGKKMHIKKKIKNKTLKAALKVGSFQLGKVAFFKSRHDFYGNCLQPLQRVNE